jgi:hypothetical protein
MPNLGCSETREEVRRVRESNTILVKDANVRVMNLSKIMVEARKGDPTVCDEGSP